MSRADEARLLDAARVGDLRRCADLVNAGANANCSDDTGMTPLLWAAREGHGTIADWLLNHGADPRLLSEGESALYLAVSAGHVGVAKALLEHDPRLLDELLEVMPVARLVALAPHSEMSALLSNRDVRLSNKGTPAPKAMLADIVEPTVDDAHLKGLVSASMTEGELQEMRALLKAGARPNVGQTPPVMVACLRGSLPALELLVANGASLDYRGMQLRTALTAAAQWGHLHVVQFLVEQGRRLDEIDSLGDSAASACLSTMPRRGRPETLAWLVEAGERKASGDDAGLGQILGLSAQQLRAAKRALAKSRRKK